MKSIMRFAVIGCGARAGFHLDQLKALPDAEALAVCDTDAQRLAATAETHALEQTFGQWREMLDAVELDAAVICLPHHLHAPAAIDCLKAGLHVLVENPIAATLAEADRVAEVARQCDRRLMVGNSYRYTPPCQAARQCLRSGRIGEPVLCYGAWLGPRWMMEHSPWAGRRSQAGGGPLIGYGTHLFDLLEWMVGPIRSVDATVSARVVGGIDVEDSAAVLLRFANEAAGAFALSWADHTNAFRLDTEILGTRGRIVFSPRGTLRVATAEGADLADVKPGAASPHAMYEEFLAAVEEDREPMTNAVTGRRALAWALAAYRSTRLGRQVGIGPGET